MPSSDFRSETKTYHFVNRTFHHPMVSPFRTNLASYYTKRCIIEWMDEILLLVDGIELSCVWLPAFGLQPVVDIKSLYY
jgi:hypothetical protein